MPPAPSHRQLALMALGVWSLALTVAVAAGVIAPQDPPKNARPAPAEAAPSPPPPGAPEAPAAFDGLSNGFATPDGYAAGVKAFEKTETVKDDGLGPVYNSTSCVSCHQNPVTGSSSQVAELRAGHNRPDPASPSRHKVEFVEPAGGSVIRQRATEPKFQERVQPEDDVRTFRMSNTILGDGFVEVIRDRDILAVKRWQRQFGLEGFAVVVQAAVGTKAPATCDSVDEFVQVERVGRFGWKCQEASLLNFAAGAYNTEMGITNPLQPLEGNAGAAPHPLEDVKCDPMKPGVVHPFGVDVEAFTKFMRSTKAPPRFVDPAAAADVAAGELLFRDNKALGCAVCHYPDYTTPPAGEKILMLGGGARGSDMEVVAEALGGKVIHPFSDFLLHDVGTGDGIAQTQHANLPPKGHADRVRIPDAVVEGEGLVRVVSTGSKGGPGQRRTLAAESKLDERTASKMRTAPLWGLRMRPQLMHDGLSLTVEDAIGRHRGQAEGVRLKYAALPDAQKKQLLAFLGSL